MSQSPTATLGSMMTGYWISQSIYVVAKLGIADLVASGPQTAEQLAAASDVLPRPLYRVLRALASVGVFREDADGRFALTPLAEPLRSDVPESQRAMAIMLGEEQFVCWSRVLETVRTGQSTFRKIYGEPIFDWFAKHPQQAAVFDQAMVSAHGRETHAIADAYDFAQLNVLADVGGGNGSVIRGILKRNPKLRGMLCDLPNVIERAKPLVAQDGLSDRLQTVPTDFFESIPPGADAYLMRHIIHDWYDDDCLAILRNIHRAMQGKGRLLVIDSVIRPGNDADFSKLLDLNMMVVPGGKERTEEEFGELFTQAGFRLTRIVPTASDVSIVEGVPL